VDLRWLLTGEASDPSVAGDHPAVARVAALLADHPDAAGPLTAFLDLLCGTMTWPEKAPATETPAPVGAPARSPAARAALPDWIPVLGRSAAGVPRFWSDAEDGRGVTRLDDLVARHAGRAPDRRRPARAAEDGAAGESVAQLITLREPDETHVAEFVVAAGLKARHPDAFAVRIDGDSMAPEIRHGDLVVCSPSASAAEGRPAVVQLDGQIGVTCKLVRRDGDTVHLVPVNEQFAPQAFPADRLVWALRVLARIRAE